MNKDVIVGLIIGFIASAIGLTLSLLFLGTGESISESLNIAIAQGVFTKLVSIGALLNLAAFFLFINTNKESRAKGVLIATIIVALITIIIRFT
jgi:heme/copper-type cytochrome/quinol oxidase subunit 4